jgi:hypothetical protein
MKTDFFKQLTEEQQAQIVAKFPKMEPNKTLYRRTNTTAKSGNPLANISYIKLMGNPDLVTENTNKKAFNFTPTQGIEDEKQKLALMLIEWERTQKPAALIGENLALEAELAEKEAKIAEMSAKLKKLEADQEAEELAKAEAEAAAKAEAKKAEAEAKKAAKAEAEAKKAAENTPKPE